MTKKDRDVRAHQKAFFLFVVSLLFIVGMVVVVAQSTNWLSFARGGSARAMQFCLSRFSKEQCEKVLNRGGNASPEVKSWCNSKCGGSGLEGKICTSVCIGVNSGQTCQAACGRYQNPRILGPCTKRCPSVIMPTPTPTPTPRP